MNNSNTLDIILDDSHKLKNATNYIEKNYNIIEKRKLRISSHILFLKYY